MIWIGMDPNIYCSLAVIKIMITRSGQGYMTCQMFSVTLLLVKTDQKEMSKNWESFMKRSPWSNTAAITEKWQKHSSRAADTLGENWLFLQLWISEN